MVDRCCQVFRPYICGRCLESSIALGSFCNFNDYLLIICLIMIDDVLGYFDELSEVPLSKELNTWVL